MEQREIIDLLLEAADPASRGNRRNHIAVALSSGICEITDPEDEGWYYGFDLLFNELFCSTLEHAPQWLPRLFAVFAFAAGDREAGVRSADIDWAIAREYLPQHPSLSAHRATLVSHPGSNQAAILSMLLEAAMPSCSWERRAALQDLLMSSVDDDDLESEERSGRLLAFRALASTLFCETIEHAPSSLPYLYPVFAIICGRREKGVLTADPDWSLISTFPEI